MQIESTNGRQLHFVSSKSVNALRLSRVSGGGKSRRSEAHVCARPHCNVVARVPGRFVLSRLFSRAGRKSDLKSEISDLRFGGDNFRIRKKRVASAAAWACNVCGLRPATSATAMLGRRWVYMLSVGAVLGR